MKIAYILIHLQQEFIEGGPGKKVADQTKNWIDSGNEVKIFLHSPDKIENDNYIIFSFPTSKNFLVKEISRSKALSKLIQSVRSYQPDIIYLRYGIYSYPLHKLFDISPVIIELNSLDTVEKKQKDFFAWLYNQFTRDITFNQATGFVSVSRDVLNHASIKKYNKPAIVIPTGISIEDKDFFPPPQNQNPRMVFIGSPDLPWHGVDKIIELAIKAPSLNFDIIGYDQAQVKASLRRQRKYHDALPSNVFCHGFLHEDKYLPILKNADVAISSLALHRIQINEISPIKTREYLAYGIPVLVAYEDSDFLTTNFDFILKIPNEENNINDYSNEILDFVYRMIGKRVDKELVIPLIQSRNKENQRLEFFKDISEIDFNN